MLDKKDLTKVKNSIDKYDKQRELVTAKSREIVRMSKKVIYDIHRDNLISAKKSIDAMNKELKKLKILANAPKLVYVGSYKVAIQEYVEAVCFFEYVKNKKIPTNTKLKLEPDHYLLGLIDLTGELVRKAINEAIKENYTIAIDIKLFVTELYGELMQFDFANGELRKKFDSIKYDLKKLEDLVLNLKMSNKI